MGIDSEQVNHYIGGELGGAVGVLCREIAVTAVITGTKGKRAEENYTIRENSFI